MSTAYGRETVALHFTWRLDSEGVHRVLPHIEAALQPFDPRPHWGKVYAHSGQDVAARYPHRDDFVKLVHDLDPRGVFRNAMLDDIIG